MKRLGLGLSHPTAHIHMQDGINIRYERKINILHASHPHSPTRQQHQQRARKGWDYEEYMEDIECVAIFFLITKPYVRPTG